MAVCFTIVHKDSQSKARCGILHTKSGDVKTPFFMPVATKTAVKHISSEDLESMGAKAIISNAFILSLRPGVDIIKNFRGISKFMSYPGVVFTDSGGFQMYSPRLYMKSREDGVLFRNPYSGEKRFITPELDMEIQLGLQSDVAMCLDSMPLLHESKESIAEAVKTTTRWAKRCKLHHDALQADLAEGKKQLLFGIIQGGIHEDLRDASAQALTEIEFDGFSIGGLALGESKEDEYHMIEVAQRHIPESKPVYLMGAGNPPELIEAIARGVDIFDSRFPTQNARRGTLFTSNGFLRVTNAPYKTDPLPIDPQCSCFVCKRYSRAYLNHLLTREEGVGFRLASYHNLYFLQDLMRRAQSAIADGTFDKLRVEIALSFSR